MTCFNEHAKQLGFSAQDYAEVAQEAQRIFENHLWPQRSATHSFVTCALMLATILLNSDDQFRDQDAVAAQLDDVKHLALKIYNGRRAELKATAN